jgi:hypothetical protein
VHQVLHVLRLFVHVRQRPQAEKPHTQCKAEQFFSQEIALRGTEEIQRQGAENCTCLWERRDYCLCLSR